MIVMWGLYFFSSLLVVLALSFVSGLFSLNEKTSMDFEMYECGIEPIQDKKIPFYLHFFLIGVLFLLFDVELIICIPLIWVSINEKMWGVLWFSFFLVLFVGLLLELVMGTISWKE